MRVSSDEVWPLNDPNASVYWAIVEDFLGETQSDDPFFWYHRLAGAEALAERVIFAVTGEFPLPTPGEHRNFPDHAPQYVSDCMECPAPPAVKRASTLTRIIYDAATRLLSPQAGDLDRQAFVGTLVLWRLEQRGVLDSAAMAAALEEARRVGREGSHEARRWWHRRGRARLLGFVAEKPDASQVELAKKLQEEIIDWNARGGGHQRVPGIEALRKTIRNWLRDQGSGEAS